jgi:hypothetical protein
VVFANNQIAEERRNNQQYAEMCCVITAAVADANMQTLYFVHVGDTRLYRYRNGTLEKLTRDHSLVGLREDAGDLTEEEAMNHPQRNVILREAGSVLHRIDDPEFLDYGESSFLPGDYCLVCSDGLTDMITKNEIISRLQKKTSAQVIVRELIDAANEKGGKDNITVVLAKNMKARDLSITAKETFGTALPHPEVMPFPVMPRSPSSRKKRRLSLIAAVCIVVIACVCGYILRGYFGTEETPQPAALASADTTAARADSTPVPGYPDSFVHRNVPFAPVINDTLRVDKTKSYDEILKLSETGSKYVVLLPATEKARHLPAIELFNDSLLAGKDSLILKNLIINGFDTGILVKRKVFVLLDNVIFEDVKNPVSYEFSKVAIPGKQKDFILKIVSANK